MEKNLKKPVAVITGASSGIGAALAAQLIDEYRLVLVARRAQRLEELCSSFGPDARFVCADLAERKNWATLAAQIHDCFGQVDKVIHNAGVFTVGPHQELRLEDLDHMWELNVTAVFMLTTHLLPALRQSDSGHIISISSIAAVAGFANCGAYGASKAAIEAWSSSLREELRADKIRVSIVAPGATSTEIWGPDSPFDRSKMASPDDIALTIKTCLLLPETASVDKLTVMPSGGAL